MRVQATSDDPLTRGEGIGPQRGDRWDSSPSLVDLEEQRTRAFIEGGWAPESCERIDIDHGNKVR